MGQSLCTRRRHSSWKTSTLEMPVATVRCLERTGTMKIWGNVMFRKDDMPMQLKYRFPNVESRACLLERASSRSGVGSHLCQYDTLRLNWQRLGCPRPSVP